VAPEMYALINPTPFHLNMATKTTTPDYPEKKDANGNIVPYTRKEKSKIGAKFLHAKNYF
jgi:hypothetical protein